jgi:pyruvate kinase
LNKGHGHKGLVLGDAGLGNFDILSVTDGIVVARGDLAMEVRL